VAAQPIDALDLEAIRDALSGQEDAFRRLVDKYGDSIYNLAFRMTGNAADAEDLAQDAFLQAYAKLRDFRVGMRFHPWLYTIALNLCRNHLRRKAIVKWIPWSSGEEGRAAMDVRCAAPDPEEALLEGEAEERLQKALAALPLKYREIFLLRQAQELSYEEIAEITGLPMGTVEVRLYRARRLLLQALMK
jgi:RNA polymerase sigma-70 factor (ECF subfamily)